MTLHPNNLAARDYVPVAPLREAFKRSPMSLADMARSLGWMWTAMRTPRGCLGLGITGYYSRGKWRHQEYITYRTACLLAEAMDIDPYEVGI